MVDEVFDANGDVDETLWAATDHLGSVNQLLDNNENIVEHREYDSFGAIDQVFDESGTTKGSHELDSDVAFAGRAWDDDAQLYYNRARWYEPESGRFIGEDPAQDGTNWYAYAGNDPVNFRDPTGLNADAGNPLNDLSSFGSIISTLDGNSFNNQFSNPIFSGPTSTFGIDSLSSPGIFGAQLGSVTNFGTSDSNFSSVGSQFAAEVRRRDSSFNQLLLVDSRSLSSIDRLRLDPSTPEIASIRQFGGGLGLGFQREAAQLQARVNGSSTATEAFFTQYAATGSQFTGDLLQSFTENSPSYEVNYTSGRSEIILGGEPSTGALANTALLLSPAFSRTPVKTATVPSTRGYTSNAANAPSSTPHISAVTGRPLNLSGRVQGQINVANGRTRFTPVRQNGNPVSAGFDHVVSRHFNGANSSSQFTISQSELKSVLQSRTVTQAPINQVGKGAQAQFVRTVDVGRTVGRTRVADGAGQTSRLRVHVDEAGNLITAFPVP